jgi:3-mercaptopyruvate sulfurtransferase SseA
MQREKGMKIIPILTALSIFLTLSPVGAQDFKNLSSAEVKDMIDAKKKTVLVDARTEQEYREGHIPTAINISPEKLTAIGRYLPKNRKTPIVFYCRGTA